MSTQRYVATVVMIAGLGWTAGNFAPPDTMPAVTVNIITALHALPIALLILFSLPLMRSQDNGPRWACRGMTGVAAFYALAMVAIEAYSIANPDPNAFGIHNLADAEPAALVFVGTLLWLASLIPARTRPALLPWRHAA